MPQLPEAVIRGYAPEHPKIVPFPKGTFFCESKTLILYIAELGHIAFAVRILLASIAKHKDGIRIARMHPNKIAEKVGCTKRAVYKALSELKKKRFILGSEGNWMLIEPSEAAKEVPLNTSKATPEQLYLF